MNKRVILVGAGHAHLHILKQARTLTGLGATVAIVAEDDFWYSGMATGMLGGSISPDADRVGIEALTSSAGATLHRGSMVALDRNVREVVLHNGQRLGFDLLSLNLGSLPPPLPGKVDAITPVKPIRSLVELRHRIEKGWLSSHSHHLRVAVVGGGVTAVEIAANLSALAQLNRRSVSIVVYSRSEPLAGIPRGAASALLRHLGKSGVDVRWPATVASVAEEGVCLNDRSSEDFDFVINATGLVPPRLAGELGLAANADGALVVDKFLRSKLDPEIFAVGDCAAFDGHALPRVGVYAVRQAPVLLANLCASLSGSPLTAFVPQKRYLSIVGLGTSALMMRGSLWFKGPPALWLKRRIDKRFVDSYDAASSSCIRN
ncbi:MAG: FAD-dependent oxidoreductase [Mesorhizobium sp.]